MAVLYLGIDGVLLRGNGTGTAGWELAPHAGEFLRWAISAHTPFWLTSRTHAGIIAAFKECAAWDAELEPLLPAVTTLPWTGTKTAAINMDATPTPEDPLVLDHHGCRSRWIEVNTNVFPDALLAAMTVVEVLCGK